MKKSKSSIIAIIGIAIVIIGIVIAIWISNCINNFFAPEDGIHVLGKFVNIQYQEKCYFIDIKDEQIRITGDSTFTITGILYDKYKNNFKENHWMSGFNGHIQVDAYPLSLTEGYDSHKGSINSNNTISFATFKEVESSLPFYHVYILRSNPEIVVIYIHLENDETLVAVCGENEEDAIENYQYFLENPVSD